MGPLSRSQVPRGRDNGPVLSCAKTNERSFLITRPFVPPTCCFTPTAFPQGGTRMLPFLVWPVAIARPRIVGDSTAGRSSTATPFHNRAQGREAHPGYHTAYNHTPTGFYNRVSRMFRGRLALDRSQRADAIRIFVKPRWGICDGSCDPGCAAAPRPWALL